MNLDEQLETLLASLGVVFEEPHPTTPHERASAANESANGAANDPTKPRFTYGVRNDPPTNTGDDDEPYFLDHDEQMANAHEQPHCAQPGADDENLSAPSEMSLFQTSREHFGVFYRLDLVGGVPQVRIFMPDDQGALKMRCYLTRATLGSPLHDWFIATRLHDGSQAYDDARDSAQQHLLFAAGELMKRLFWTGDLEALRFPAEIEVLRLA